MPSEEAAREAIRWTARLSLLLLCAALAGEGVGLPAWATRRGLLRGLAASHTVHAAAVATLAVLTHGRNLLERGSPVLVLGGALAYVFIYWGALHPGSRLTSWGLLWVWVVFLVSYGARAWRAPIPWALAVGLLLAALAARLGGVAAGKPEGEASRPAG